MKQEWLLVGVVLVLISLCIGIDAWTFPTAIAKGDKTPLFFVATIVHAFGAALWITMDRRRRGLEIGKWRFAAVFLGPFAISLYLILEYRIKAVYLIPLTLSLYFVVGFVPLFIVALLRLLGA